ERFIGRPQRELVGRLAEPLPCESPPGKTRLAAHVLKRLSSARSEAAVSPREARAAVFGAAARTHDRPAVLATVAQTFRIPVEALEDALYADLPGERRVVPPEKTPAPSELALRTNLALAQALLFRADTVEIALYGNARAIVRHAK